MPFSRIFNRTAPAAGILTLLSTGVFAGMESGRYIDEGKSFTIRLSAGQLDGVQGSVEETKRAGTPEVTDEGRFLETYTFEELGFGDSFASFGIELEQQWQYVTLHLDVKYASLDASSVARRDYAIGVEDIEFEGESYDYMLIPDGQPFDAEMDTLIADLKFRITPFHFESEDRYVSFSPWVVLGIYALAGDFTVDAGPAQGTTLYEADPFVYVIGGKGEGTAAAAMPQIGAGGELRFGLWEMNYDRAELVLQGEFTWMDVSARTGDFGISSRNEKNIDTYFFTYDLSAQLELPMSDELDLVFGVGYEHMEVEADIVADRLAPGETTTEKYDKFVSMEMDSYYVFGGVKF